jgi:hypothetical protein
MGSLRDIQRSGGEGLVSNRGAPNGYQHGQLIATYELAELTQKTNSFRLEEVTSFNPLRNEVYEDVKVYSLGEDKYLIKGIQRDYAIMGLVEVSLDRIKESELRVVTRKKYWLFGPRVQIKKVKRSGWVALKDTVEVEMEVRGTLLLGR